jgi:membrane-associated phospholipid phosphatase
VQQLRGGQKVKKPWIALVVVTAGLLVFLSYFFWDIPVALYCRTLNRSILDAAEIVTKAGESKWFFMILVPLFLLFRFFLKDRKQAMRMLFLIASISISGIVNTMIKWVLGRNRPINLFHYDFYGFNFFEVIYESTSFPSGHALTVFSLAAALSILYPHARFFLFPAAAVIALSRVILTSHFLSDILAGAVLGVICTQMIKAFFDRYKLDLSLNSRKPP